MACTTPILISQNELANHVLKRTDNLDAEDVLEAINSAIGTMSARVKACFCYEYPCPLECGVCEYPLPCCGIRDVVPWVKPRDCGCRPLSSDECCENEACWRRLDTYEISCDKLITDGTVEGDLRLEIYVPNPSFPTRCLTLAKEYVRGDSQIWIEGRVQLPPLGWLRLGDEGDYVSFRCWEQTRYEDTGGFDVSLFDEWVMGDIDPVAGSEIPGIDPIEGLDPGGDVTCGVNTVAYTIGEYCFSGFNETYPKGAEVELAFAAPTEQAISALKRQALVYAHELQLTRCTSPQDRQFYADRMQLYAELSQNDMLGFKPDRKITQKNTRETSFWFTGGKSGRCRSRPQRRSAGKRSYILR